jgi:flagellar protein FliL
MAKEKKEDLEGKEEEPKAKKGNMKLVIIIAALVLVVCAGGATGFYLFSKADSKKPPEAKPVVITIWPMEAFIVNISDTNGERYLKLVVQLELSEPTVIPELEQLKPRLRDSILDLLTPKPYKELVDLSGKQRLRDDIAGRVNNMLSKGKVTKVYFTEFVVQ